MNYFILGHIIVSCLFSHSPLYFLHGLCEKHTDFLIYIRKNLYFCKTRFRKQYNKEKNGINNENKNYGSSAVGCGADSKRTEDGRTFGVNAQAHAIRMGYSLAGSAIGENIGTYLGGSLFGFGGAYVSFGAGAVPCATIGAVTGGTAGGFIGGYIGELIYDLTY